MTFKKKLLSSLLAGALFVNGPPLALAAENEVIKSGGTGKSDITLTVEDTRFNGDNDGNNSSNDGNNDSSGDSNNGGGSGSNSGGSGGSSGSHSDKRSSFVISIEKTEGVETTPSGDVSVNRNNDLTVKIAAKDGFVITDVVVDGISQGPIESYTFKRVQAKHTLSVEAEPVSMLTDEHIAYINGYPDGGVHPWANITRAETSAVFYRLLNNESRERYNSSAAPFTDTSGSWAQKEIATLTEAGILNGYQDGAFRPNAPITRAEFAAIASRFDKLEEGSQQFDDVSPSHWAYQVIASAAKKGWVNGYEDGTFRPDNNITRSEAVKITNAVLERTCDEEYMNAHPSDVVHFNDISDMNWAYLDIMEAANPHDYKREDQTEKWTGMVKEAASSASSTEKPQSADGARAVKMVSVSVPISRAMQMADDVIVSEDNPNGVRLQFIFGRQIAR